MKIIAVSGTPGTGKTEICKKLCKKLGFKRIDVNALIFKNKLSEGYDKQRKTKIIDIKKLNKLLIKEISLFKKENNAKLSNKKISLINKTNKNPKIKGIIIDSHLSHYLPRKYVDLCIITKCSIKELYIRLKKRRYTKKKIEENIQAEIFDICRTEAVDNKHKILTIDTTKTFNIGVIAKKMGG
jgi:adenylate kinase